MSKARISPIRVGVFELDLAARELRKRGVRVKLQDQPFRVLEALLEKPGQIVTRDELKDRLWADDEFVEFDKSLNTSVQKIRQALGDSSTSPRFVETIPRRGYRFVAPVEAPAAPEASEAPPEIQQDRRRRIPWPALAALVIVVGLAGWWISGPSDAPFDPNAYQLRRLTSDGGLAFQPAISADGKFVVYSSDRAGDGGLDIWLQQTGGGDPIQLTSDTADELEPSFSPDGTQVVYRSGRDGGVYVVSSLGGEPRLLAPSGRRPRFSPDGKRVTYWIGKEHLPGAGSSLVMSVALEGGEPIEVGYGRSPVWSPGGDKLLYLRNSSPGVSEWVTAELNGEEPPATGALQVLRESGLEADPKIIGRSSFIPDRWLRDGRVLFSAAGGQALNIWSVHISLRSGRVSGSPQRITTGSGEHRVVSAANDLALAFSDVSENRDIWILPADTNRGAATGELYRTTANAAADDFPSLSDDGTILAFRSNRSGAIDVWMKNLITDDTKQLTATDRNESSIIVKADGELVSYTISEQLQGEAPRSVYAIHTRDGRIQKLCEDCVASDWSPSGNLLVGYGRSAVARELGVRRAVSLTDLTTGESRVIFENQPDWRFSPDERWLAFHNSSLGGVGIRQVFVAPLPAEGEIDEGQLIPITDGSDNSFLAAWSPDGMLVYYVSDRDAYRCIYAQPMDPKTKRPSGAVREVYHSHDARLSLASIRSFGDIGLSVAKDKIAFTMADTTGEIWIMEPRNVR